MRARISEVWNFWFYVMDGDDAAAAEIFTWIADQLPDHEFEFTRSNIRGLDRFLEGKGHDTRLSRSNGGARKPSPKKLQDS